MTRPARILIAAGGTGGHVYPAIAVADALRRKVPQSAVAFAGTTHRIEWEAVPRAGYSIYPITAAAYSRKSRLRNLSLPFRLLKGLAQSLRLVGDFDADVVFGVGGFVAAPVGLAAWMRRRPLVLQEQNAYAGVTNKMLGSFAEEVHIAFPEAREAFPKARVHLSGNPVRTELGSVGRLEARRRLGLPDRSQVILCFGGSLGSQALNEALLEGVDDFLARTEAHLIWQTGKLYHDRVAERAPRSDRVHVRQYLHDMPAAYAAANLALCRSGASTCAELMVTGTPAVLVPSPNVAEDHQTHNARSLVAAGAADLLPEVELKAGWVDRVAELLSDAQRLDSMAKASRGHAVGDAADRIASSILQLASRRAA